MKAFLYSKKYWIIAVAIIIGGGWWLQHITPSGIPDGVTMEAVTRGEVKEVVSETGLVVAAQEANLAFERGGKISEISVKEGDEVMAGDALMKIYSAQQSADLASAYARLKAEQIRLDELVRGADSASLAVSQSGVDVAKTALDNAKSNLTEVTTQQDQLVKNALRTLRSSGLQAYLVSNPRENSTYTFTAPTITGTYESDEEGVYKIEVYSSGSQSGSSFRLSGLETDTGTVSTVNSMPLGKRGLYIQFPEDFASRTTWEVPIPNINSSSYTTNSNAYKATLEAHDLAIASAESAVASAAAVLEQSQAQLAQASASARDERVDAQKALVQQMQASVQSAQASYDTTSIIAPFAGIVTAVNTEVGEVVPGASPMVSLISNDSLELLVNISESDISEVDVADPATVTFDAYGDLTLKAYVTRIAPNANIIDGVRVFEVRLQFDNRDKLIKSGLSADINILAATKENVIAIPSRAVVEKDGARFVRSYTDNTLKNIPIIVGLRGSDGMTEVRSGLTEGEIIITFAQEDALKQLEAN